jgi:hypothetical protein
VALRPAGQHVGQSPCQCVIPEDVLIQLFPPDDERLSLETCRGREINTLKKVKKVRQVGCKSRVGIKYYVCNIVARRMYSIKLQPNTFKNGAVRP